jgi:hypothetical protein
MTILLMIMAGLVLGFAWGILGALYVFYLDLFGRRHDYDKDYPLSAWQLALCGPFVWWMEYRKRRR